MKRPFYTPDEDAILREHYAAKGAAWIFQSGLLPGRCDRSIKSRAQHIGLAVPGRTMPRTDGIKNLSDFKARCRISGIDGEDNCWVYCGNGDEPVDGIWWPGGKFGDLTDGKGSSVKPAVAGWLLSGRKLSPGQCVWHASSDCHPQCGNPEHVRAGSRKSLFAVTKTRTPYIVSERRSIANTRRNMARATPSEVVRQAEAMFDAGATVKAVMRDLSLGESVAREIKAGTHTFSRGRTMALPASSVWQMARAA